MRNAIGYRRDPGAHGIGARAECEPKLCASESVLRSTCCRCTHAYLNPADAVSQRTVWCMLLQVYVRIRRRSAIFSLDSMALEARRGHADILYEDNVIVVAGGSIVHLHAALRRFATHARRQHMIRTAVFTRHSVDTFHADSATSDSVSVAVGCRETRVRGF